MRADVSGELYPRARRVPSLLHPLYFVRSLAIRKKLPPLRLRRNIRLAPMTRPHAGQVVDAPNNIGLNDNGFTQPVVSGFLM